MGDTYLAYLNLSQIHTYLYPTSQIHVLSTVREYIYTRYVRTSYTLYRIEISNDLSNSVTVTVVSLHTEDARGERFSTVDEQLRRHQSQVVGSLVPACHTWPRPMGMGRY